MNRPMLLVLTAILASSPLSFAKSEVETLRIRCAEQERQIRDLEEQNSKLRLMNGMAPKYASRPAPAAAAETQTPAAGAAAHSKAAGAGSTTYTVRAGDSWERVARKFGTQPTQLAAMNGTKSDAMLLEGQRLKVPASVKTATEPAPKGKSALPSGMSTPTTTYLVKQGETFYSIGMKLGIPTDSLVAANPTLKATELRPGITIQLAKTGRSAAAESAKSESAKSESVKSESVKSESVKSEAVKSEAVKSEAVKSEAAKSKAAKSEPAKSTAKSVAASPAASASTKVPKTVLQPTASTPVSMPHAASPPVSSPPPAPSSAPMATALVATAPNPGIRSITTDGTTTYGEFADKHGTTVGRLNNLNALDLVETTVLAKGSELYVPAQP